VGEILKIARDNCAQLIELGLFAIASPFFPRWRIRKNFHLDGDWANFCRKLRSKNTPQLLLIPHQTLTEALVFLPLLLGLEVDRLPLGIIYRPFRHKVIEQYVRRTRGRFGLRMLSRKGGLAEASHLMRKGGCVGLLFDQYAGGAGALTTLCGRVTSSTLLAEILGRESSAEAFVMHAKRTGFWQATFVIEPLTASVGALTDAMNEWLERRVRKDEIFRNSWLWVHNRWKRPVCEILNLHGRKQRLKQSCEYYGYVNLPKQFRVFIRMPKQIYAIALALPILRAIREGRTDAHMTILCAPDHAAWLQTFPWLDEVLAFSSDSLKRLHSAFRLRTRFPDLHISIDNSFVAAVEAWLIGAPVRMGIQPIVYQMFPFLTHKTSPKKHLDMHPTIQWREFFRNYGLLKNPSFEPIAHTHFPKKSLDIAFCLGINGSRANKFWSVDKWKILASYLRQRNPNLKITLFGRDADAAEVASEIVASANDKKIENLTGPMPPEKFVEKLLRYSVVVASDLDGVHLANAYGIQTAAILTKEKPNELKPIYNCPHVDFGGDALCEPSIVIEVGKAVQIFLEKARQQTNDTASGGGNNA
jgi:ADP-heptose:LPS heptosyltransferase/lauroyl/myristoyl acyltransferase